MGKLGEKMLEKLIRIVKDKNIDDIYLTGFVDIEDGIAQFHHDLRFLYLELDDKYLKFESFEQSLRLRISIVESINFDYEVDEDMVRAKSSVSEIVLNDTMAFGNDIGEIIFYNLEQKIDLICDAIELKLVNGKVIFLDPSYYFGINIGGKEQKEKWKLNIKKDTKVCETLIKI